MIGLPVFWWQKVRSADREKKNWLCDYGEAKEQALIYFSKVNTRKVCAYFTHLTSFIQVCKGATDATTAAWQMFVRVSLTCQPARSWVSVSSDPAAEPGRPNKWKCDWQLQYSWHIDVLEQWQGTVASSVSLYVTTLRSEKPNSLPAAVVYCKCVFVSMYFIKTYLFLGVGDSWHF